MRKYKIIIALIISALLLAGCEYQASDQSDYIESLEEQISSLSAENNELNDEINKLENQISDLEKENSNLATNLSNSVSNAYRTVVENKDTPGFITINLKDGETVSISSDIKYCGSERSEVYHYIDCDYVCQIAKHNFVTYASKEDAEAKGKRPCKGCEP